MQKDLHTSLKTNKHSLSSTYNSENATYFLCWKLFKQCEITWIFIFFHLISIGVSFDQEIIWARQCLSFCTPSLLVNCMQRKCISAVLWQNQIKHESNIHPNVFNSFVTYGESHKQDFHKPLDFHSNSISPHFTIEVLPSVSSPFFSLEPSKSPPKDTEDFNRSWKAFAHAIFPHHAKFPFLEIATFFLNTGSSSLP